jgi:hypothetical protein
VSGVLKGEKGVREGESVRFPVEYCNIYRISPYGVYIDDRDGLLCIVVTTIVIDMVYKSNSRLQYMQVSPAMI